MKALALCVAALGACAASEAHLDVAPGRAAVLKRVPLVDPVVVLEGPGTLFVLQHDQVLAVITHAGTGPATLRVPVNGVADPTGDIYVGVVAGRLADALPGANAAMCGKCDLGGHGCCAGQPAAPAPPPAAPDPGNR